MAIFEDLRAGPSPAVEELLEGFDTSSPLPLTGRELVSECASAAAYLAVCAAMAALIPTGRPLEVPIAVALMVAYALASRVRFAIGYGFTVPTQLVFVPMLFLLPPGMVPAFAVAAALLGALPEFLRRQVHPSKVAVGIGDTWHAVGPALVLGLADMAGPDLSRWPVLVAALLAQLAFDAGTSTVRLWVGMGVRPGLQPPLLGWVGLIDVLLSPVGLLAAIASVDAPYTVLLLLPLLGVFAVFAAERRARLSQSLELSRAYRGTTLLLGDVLEADDEYTGVHSQGVVGLSVAVADAMGLSSSERRRVEFGALLHDVGKIAVPKHIINKPGPLTDDEWIVVKTHTIEGQRMLDRVGGLLSDVGRIVRSSHERWDGGGYPDGLAADQIPLGATIVSCCDAFNAMTTDRPYRPARPVEEALEELRAGSGTQFNPAVVEELTKIVARLQVQDRDGAAVAVPHQEPVSEPSAGPTPAMTVAGSPPAMLADASGIDCARVRRPTRS
jgi:HD-GYP domain-containing protein (c-di-GMP phosphodiesterase class II)